MRSLAVVTIAFLLAQCILHGQLLVSAERSKVILASMDGFRYDYLTKARTPNFNRMIAEGVTMPYMQNTFITNTFPSHYTMATGLYSQVHGIASNQMYDPEFGPYFKTSTTETRWWEGGEPIWITAKKADLKTGIYFWPGSEVEIQGLRPDQWFPYNNSVPFEGRVETGLKWMSQDEFDLGVMYFNEPDSSGHDYGPDHPQLVPVIEHMDSILGLLLEGLDKANLTDKVNVILVSDHGMANCDLLNKFSESRPDGLCERHSLVGGRNPRHYCPASTKARKLVRALSGIDHLHVMLKEDILDYFHLKHNRRVMPVFAMMDEGWTVTDDAMQRRQWGYKGDHGYNNSNPNMHPIFIARGPAFKSGKKVDPIMSLDIYPLISHLLDIPPASHNGSLERAQTLLKSSQGNAAPQKTLTAVLLAIPFISCLSQMAFER